VRENVFILIKPDIPTEHQNTKGIKEITHIAELLYITVL
jgi:hypothetical protein